MNVTCPYCGKADVRAFEECPGCSKIVDLRDVARPLTELLKQLTPCPGCKLMAFDGHECHQCHISISDKAKKALPCVLISKKEKHLVSGYWKCLDG